MRYQLDSKKVNVILFKNEHKLVCLCFGQAYYTQQKVTVKNISCKYKCTHINFNVSAGVYVAISVYFAYISHSVL